MSVATDTSRTAAVLTVERPAIPFSRVQQIVCDLLGVEDLRGIRSLTVHRGAVIVEVLAVNERGSHFAVGDEVAIDRIHFPVDRDLPDAR